jgi:hypothetical protein
MLQLVPIHFLGLTTGELKFRLDNSWATNFGDDGNNYHLTLGSNIAVTAGITPSRLTLLLRRIQ